MRSIPLFFMLLLMAAVVCGESEVRSEQLGGFSLGQLQVRGSQYSTDDFRRALRLNPEVLDAICGPTSPDEISQVLQTQIADILQRVGISQADVTVGYVTLTTPGDDNEVSQIPRKVVVDVREGPQYRFGELRVVDLQPELAQAIRQRVNLPEPGLPVPLDHASLQRLHQGVGQAFADAGYPLARYRVATQINQPAGTADYEVTLEDLGRPAIIDRIDIIGNQQHESSAILQYLDIDRGKIHDRLECERLSGLLRDSGRFYRVAVSVEGPEMEEDLFALRIEVAEIHGVAALDQPLSREDQTLLKAGHWLERFIAGDHDLVFDFPPYHGVVSARDGVLISVDAFACISDESLGMADASSMPLPLATLLLDDRGITLDASESKSRFHLPIGLQIKNASLVADFDAGQSGEERRRLSLRGGGSLSTQQRQGDDPFIHFDRGNFPFALLALGERFDWQWDGDWLVAQVLGDEESTEPSSDGYRQDVFIRIHAETGELLMGDQASSALMPHLRFHPGAFAEARQRHHQQTAEYVDMQRPLAQILAVLDQIGGISTLDDLPRSLVEDVVGTADFVLWLVRAGLGDEIDSESAHPFPIDASALDDDEWSLATWCTCGYIWVDDLFPADSWPHSLASTWLAAYSQRPELERWSQHGWRIVFAEEQGPLLDWWRMDVFAGRPEAARYYAQRAAAKTSVDGFRRDYDPLVDDRYLCGRLVQRSLDILARQSPEDLDQVLEKVQPQLAKVIRNLVSHLRAQNDGDGTLNQRVRRALDAYWENELRGRMEVALRDAALR